MTATESKSWHPQWGFVFLIYFIILFALIAFRQLAIRQAGPEKETARIVMHTSVARHP